MKNLSKIMSLLIVIILVIIILTAFFVNNNSSPLSNNELQHEKKWGIYSLDLQTNQTQLIFTSLYPLSRIKLNNVGNKLVFSQQFNNTVDCTVADSPINLCEEICTIHIDGTNFKRLTDNNLSDILPNWSLDDSNIFFLSFKETLDIFKMTQNGENIIQIYDSSFHDSDLHYRQGKLVFTRQSQIWMINEDGTDPLMITNPPKAGEWGTSVLPFGDYDPFLNPEGNTIVFERLVDDQISHGNYDIYTINLNTMEEEAITDTGYSQGLPVWSHSGEKIVYLVGAIGDQGQFDIYLMNANGSDNHNITPDYYPVDFLCHDPIFSKDDSNVYFIGEWYSD